MGVKERLIIIHRCRGIGWKTINAFLQYDPTLNLIFEMSKSDFVKIFKMKSEHVELFFRDLHEYTGLQLLEKYKKENISIITIFDLKYPMLLKQIYDPPWVLYYIGDPSLLVSRSLAVVGTRTPSKYGLHSMKKILVPIIRRKWTIVSGLALGVDGFAHQLAIEEKGKTIAVLGAGFYHIYPSHHRKLAREIAINHLLLTEYPPNQPPRKWQFPLRNRIISGLSSGTLIVEAKEKSGSLITADQALEQGREIFAIPGSILNENSIGTNQLIQQGAKLVLKSEDILEEFEQNG